MRFRLWAPRLCLIAVPATSRHPPAVPPPWYRTQSPRKMNWIEWTFWADHCKRFHFRHRYFLHFPKFPQSRTISRTLRISCQRSKTRIWALLSILYPPRLGKAWKDHSWSRRRMAYKHTSNSGKLPGKLICCKFHPFSAYKTIESEQHLRKRVLPTARPRKSRNLGRRMNLQLWKCRDRTM